MLNMKMETWDSQIEIFKQMKPPLRPHSSEIVLLEEIAVALVESQQISNLQVLLLGVTQEIVNLNWPDGTMLTAVDRSEVMINQFWPGDIPDRRKVVYADWFDMPFVEASFHLIIGDGVFNFMRYPDGYRNLAGTLSGLLFHNGQMCIRIFNQPPHKEKPEDVLKYFDENQHVDYFEFRFRLATSLQDRVETGIEVTTEILDQYLVDHGIALSQLHKKSRYTPPPPPPNSGSNDNLYRITYPTNQEYISQVGPSFSRVRKLTGSHKLSDRTPIFVFSRNNIK